MTREPRSAYKAVWNALSSTQERAKAHVIGEVDEAAILAAGRETKHWLEVSVGLEPDDIILEIGCGIGRVGQALAPCCKQWIGCDVAPNMLEHARRRLAGCANVRFVELSGYDLRPIDDVSVDVVYCTVVFMHLDEWDRYNYILEACRVLKPGGRIFVDNFNLQSAQGWQIFETHRHIQPVERPAHMGRASTPQELAAYFQNAGSFEDIHVVENGAWVQAYATRSAHAGCVGGLLFEPVAAPASDIAEQLARQEQYMQRLQQSIAVKDAHIQRLEELLAQIEQGRMMRLLRWAGQRLQRSRRKLPSSS